MHTVLLNTMKTFMTCCRVEFLVACLFLSVFLSLFLSFCLSRLSFPDWTRQRCFVFLLGSPALITPACHLMWQPAYSWRSSRLEARGPQHRLLRCVFVFPDFSLSLSLSSSSPSSSPNRRRRPSMCSELAAVISACLCLCLGLGIGLQKTLFGHVCFLLTIFCLSVCFLVFFFFLGFVLVRLENRDEFLTVRLHQAV